MIEQIDARIVDIESAIQLAQRQTAERIAVLTAQKEALLAARAILTPEVLTLMNRLRALGFINF